MLAFDYTKLIIENINKIIPAVLLLITGLTSAFGYVINENWNKDEEKDQAVREVAEGFQFVLTEKREIPRSSTCGDCIKRIEKIEQTQKRWH